MLIAIRRKADQFYLIDTHRFVADLQKARLFESVDNAKKSLRNKRTQEKELSQMLKRPLTNDFHEDFYEFVPIILTIAQ
jgi:hypothetical protein